MSLQAVHLAFSLLAWILRIISYFFLIVAAVIVGIKISRRSKDVVVVNASPATSPARSPAGNEKAVPKKSKKTTTTGGTSAMNSEPSKTEEEDPGLGA